MQNLNNQRESFDTYIEEFLNKYGHNQQGFGIIDGSKSPKFYPTFDDVKSEYPTIDRPAYGTKPFVFDISHIQKKCGINELVLTKNSGIFMKIHTQPKGLTKEYTIRYIRPEDVPLVLAHNTTLQEQSPNQEISIDEILERR